jgi:predicted O-linked N-acetylglucosamine transferase (SPINDLY family)
LQQLLCSHAFVARTYGLKEEFLCKGKSYQHDKVRVGYVSGDFREHAVGFLLPTFLQSHDRECYELYAFDFTQDDGSQHRRDLLKEFDQVCDVRAMSDRQAAETILKHEIDVLIDLHGLSAGARPGIFALHPAPKQGTYIGFIGTTGMPWFDFVLADQRVLPPELGLYFTEKPLYVDGTFIPLTAPKTDLPTVQRADVLLPEHAFVMGAFGNVYKITPDMFACWMRLLHRIPNSVLWLIDDNSVTTANLKKQISLAKVWLALG